MKKVSSQKKKRKKTQKEIEIPVYFVDSKKQEKRNKNVLNNLQELSSADFPALLHKEFENANEWLGVKNFHKNTSRQEGDTLVVSNFAGKQSGESDFLPNHDKNVKILEKLKKLKFFDIESLSASEKKIILWSSVIILSCLIFSVWLVILYYNFAGNAFKNSGDNWNLTQSWSKVQENWEKSFSQFGSKFKTNTAPPLNQAQLEVLKEKIIKITNSEDNQ